LNRCRGVDDVHVVDDAAALHFAIGRLDKAVVVDARKQESELIKPMFGLPAFQSGNAAVVRGVHVADFESRTLAREAAGSKG